MGVPFEGGCDTVTRIYRDISTRASNRALPFTVDERIVNGKTVKQKRFEVRRSCRYGISVPAGYYSHVTFEFIGPEEILVMTTVRQSGHYECLKMDVVGEQAVFSSGDFGEFIIAFLVAGNIAGNMPTANLTLRIRAYGCCYIEEEVLLSVTG
jgi:hypothetical protein